MVLLNSSEVGTNCVPPSGAALGLLGVAVLLGVAGLAVVGNGGAGASIFLARKNGVPSSGKCENEGDFSIGNHCVKLSGSDLDDFQESTHQDFGGPSEWCVCLHLYKSWGKGGASALRAASSFRRLFPRAFLNVP